MKKIKLRTDYSIKDHWWVDKKGNKLKKYTEKLHNTAINKFWEPCLDNLEKIELAYFNLFLKRENLLKKSNDLCEKIYKAGKVAYINTNMSIKQATKQASLYKLENGIEKILEKSVEKSEDEGWNYYDINNSDYGGYSYSFRYIDDYCKEPKYSNLDLGYKFHALNEKYYDLNLRIGKINSLLEMALKKRIIQNLKLIAINSYRDFSIIDYKDNCVTENTIVNLKVNNRVYSFCFKNHNHTFRNLEICKIASNANIINI